MAAPTTPVVISAMCEDGLHETCSDGSMWLMDPSGNYTQLAPPGSVAVPEVATSRPNPPLAPGVIGA